MKIEHTVLLKCSPNKCLDEVQTSRLMRFVASPMVQFSPIEPNSLGDRWEQREYLMSVTLFGFLPIGRQWINISGRDRSDEMGHFHVELRDNGRGTLMSKWDHMIIIENSEQGCKYTDRVEINAGPLTPLVTLFAWYFYKHRQKRWRRLIAAGFNYDQFTF